LSTEIWDPVGLAIRMFTHSQWSHCGFAELREDGTWITLSAMLLGGVKYRPLPVSHLFLTAPNITDAYTWARTQIGKPYDYGMISGMIMNRDWHRSNRWYCSELVAAAFDQVGSPLFNPTFSVNWVTPRDILLSPSVQVIEEGVSA